MQVEDITQDENKLEEIRNNAEEIQVILVQLQRDILFSLYTLTRKKASKLILNLYRTSMRKSASGQAEKVETFGLFCPRCNM